jgi:hypothetical protein
VDFRILQVYLDLALALAQLQCLQHWVEQVLWVEPLELLPLAQLERLVLLELAQLALLVREQEREQVPQE